MGQANGGGILSKSMRDALNGQATNGPFGSRRPRPAKTSRRRQPRRSKRKGQRRDNYSSSRGNACGTRGEYHQVMFRAREQLDPNLLRALENSRETAEADAKNRWQKLSQGKQDVERVSAGRVRTKGSSREPIHRLNDDAQMALAAEREDLELAKALSLSLAESNQSTGPAATEVSTPTGDSPTAAEEQKLEDQHEPVADGNETAGNKIVKWLMDQMPDSAELRELTKSLEKDYERAGDNDEKNDQPLIKEWKGKEFYADQTGDQPSTKAREFLNILEDNFWHFLPVCRTDLNFEDEDPGRDLTWLGFWKNLSSILFGHLEGGDENCCKYTYVVKANNTSSNLVVEMRKFENSKNLDSVAETVNDKKLDTMVLKANVDDFLKMLQNPLPQTVIMKGNALEIPKINRCEWTFELKSPDGAVNSEGKFQTWLGPWDYVLKKRGRRSAEEGRD